MFDRMKRPRRGKGTGDGSGGEEPTANAAQEASTVKSGEGGGGGGGGGGRSTPRGVLRITSQEVYYEPIIDPTRIPLAGILMVAWTVFWVTATIRAIAGVLAIGSSIESFPSFCSMRMAIAVNCFEIDPTSSTDLGESGTPCSRLAMP